MFLELLKSGKATIKRGFAFRGKLPAGSNKPHICIVINKDASAEKVARYVFITSDEKNARLRMKHDPKALIVIQRSEYASELRTTSYVQCGKAYVRYLRYQVLVNNLLNGAFEKAKDPPYLIIDRIINGITESKTFSTQELKEILS